MAELNEAASTADEEPHHGSPFEVLLAFLRLGCTSFGGPIAHLGYFRKEFVERRKWCSEGTLAELIALAQSLPGPASSQVGFALGILRAGWLGGTAAWIGFTLPSALLMLLFSYGIPTLNRGIGLGLIHGLQLVAVAVVAQAVLSMQRSLAPDRTRLSLVILATGFTLILPAQIATLVAILVGGVFGFAFYRKEGQRAQDRLRASFSRTASLATAIAFCGLLAASVVDLRSGAHTQRAVFSAFYRCGALVFGGGHVVLPLLEDAVVAKGWISQQTFLAGYGAAQALPGPLFSIGAFLGAEVFPGPYAWVSAGVGLVAIFLPGLLAMATLLPLWSSFRSNSFLVSMLKGINASVVGVLIAALYHPLWTTTIKSSLDFWIAIAAFVFLTAWKTKPWIIVVGVSVISVGLQSMRM